MKRNARLGILAVAVLVVPLLCAWLISEVCWARVNDPEGKFATVEAYLSQPRRPARVQRIDVDGERFFVAYSPMDYRLAFPSGPAAYVFDPDGDLVDWSPDTGEDPAFTKRWALSTGVDTTVDEMKRR